MIEQLQLRRDTAGNWTTVNPTLASGEPGYEKDTAKFKIGDGGTPWNALAYWGTGLYAPLVSPIFQPASSSGVGLTVKGAVGQTADLQQWTDSSGTPLLRVDSGGSLSFAIGLGAYYANQWATYAVSGTFYVRDLVNGVMGLIIGPAGSHPTVQTSYNTLDDGSGNVAVSASLTAFQAFIGTGGVSLGAALSVGNPNSGASPSVIVRGAAAQTAALTQWENSAGSTLASVGADGSMVAASLSLPDGSGLVYLGGQYGTGRVTVSGVGALMYIDSPHIQFRDSSNSYPVVLEIQGNAITTSHNTLDDGSGNMVVAGHVTMAESAAPSAVTGKGQFYVATDGSLHYLGPSGTDTEIAPG